MTRSFAYIILVQAFNKYKEKRGKKQVILILSADVQQTGIQHMVTTMENKSDMAPKVRFAIEEHGSDITLISLQTKGQVTMSREDWQLLIEVMRHKV